MQSSRRLFLFSFFKYKILPLFRSIVLLLILNNINTNTYYCSSSSADDGLLVGHDDRSSIIILHLYREIESSIAFLLFWVAVLFIS